MAKRYSQKLKGKAWIKKMDEENEVIKKEK
jgi:hypothetical protein